MTNFEETLSLLIKSVIKGDIFHNVHLQKCSDHLVVDSLSLLYLVLKGYEL